MDIGDKIIIEVKLQYGPEPGSVLTVEDYSEGTTEDGIPKAIFCEELPNGLQLIPGDWTPK